jgi:hypothetical protein
VSLSAHCLKPLWAGLTEEKNKMNTKTEGTLAIITALLVLFSAMWDPRVSIVVSIVALVGFGIYKFVQKHN